MKIPSRLELLSWVAAGLFCSTAFVYADGGQLAQLNYPSQKDRAIGGCRAGQFDAEALNRAISSLGSLMSGESQTMLIPPEPIPCTGCNKTNSVPQVWFKQAQAGTDCDGGAGDDNHFKHRRTVNYYECPDGKKATCCTVWQYISCVSTYGSQPVCADPLWGNRMCTENVCP